ncbi:MAG TPA: hypothetical protein VNC50_17180 [Planctomycetia bacterium]|jgi:hypothetical protein|nr:hypothetical protein [Planctomycetia bacterium]
MVTIQLPDETAAALEERAAAAGMDLPSYLGRLAGVPEPATGASQDSAADRRIWIEHWQAMVDKMSGESLNGVDDSREAIYGDRL